MNITLSPDRNGKKPGYIYLFKCIAGGEKLKLKGAYKVGFTTQAIEKRKKQIESKRSCKLELIGYFWTEDPVREETEILYFLIDYCISGEWFRIPERMMTEDKITLWFSSDEKGFTDSVFLT